MPVSHHCTLGFYFLLLIPAGLLNAGPTPLPGSSASSRPLQDAPSALEERDEVVRDSEDPAASSLMESSREGSGFFGEDREKNKLPRALRQWRGQTDGNSSRDTDSLMGYNPSSARPLSLTLHKEPGALNSSKSFFTSAVEPLDPEQWESDLEASGFSVHSSPMLSTASASPSTRSSVTETHSMAGYFTPNHPPHQTTGPPVPKDDPNPAEEDVPTRAPTAPETAVFPSQAPLQPDDSHRDGSDEREESEEIVAFPTEVDGEEVDVWKPPPSEDPDTPAVAFTETAWHETAEDDDEEAELRHGGPTYLSETDSQEPMQVICVDWSDLMGKGYVVLNVSGNYECDEFRTESGDRLLDLLESTFSRKMNSPQGSWIISLSKPTQQEHQLLMTLANDHGVVASKDVLTMLGEIRRGLTEVGIQNFSSVSTCHSRPNQTRGDYSKLFVVLVIIGSVCVIIIASGLFYICWQRRLPKMKSMSRGEELHFVENGCHDNPTLDVTSDGQPESQEKTHSSNGAPAGTGPRQGVAGGPGKEDEDNHEEDTHL